MSITLRDLAKTRDIRDGNTFHSRNLVRQLWRDIFCKLVRSVYKGEEGVKGKARADLGSGVSRATVR